MNIHILMLARDQRWGGGVVNFVSSLEIHLSSDFHMNYYKIGQRKTWAGKLLKIFIPLLDAVRLYSTLRTNTYDVVQINPSLNIKSLLRETLFMLVLRAVGAKNVVVFIHGWDNKTATRICNSLLLKKMFLWIFGWAPVIYVLASQFKRELMLCGVEEKKIHVITTMFDGKQFNNVIRSRNDNKIHIIFLSRFVKEKGVYELIAAFGRLRVTFPKLRLILSGDGPESCGMHKLVEKEGLEKYVKFTGYVKDNVKAQVLVDSDIFVLPTYYGEGCPVSLLEAMAAGMPVITTSVGGIGDIIVDGVNGYLLDIVSAENIEASVKSLLTDKNMMKKMAEHNKQIAWDFYEAAEVTKSFEKTYRNLLERV